MAREPHGVVPGPQFIRFGPFQLDVRSGELRKHGVRIRLHEQPFRVLLMLTSRPGEVVLREEIRQVLWTDNTVVEFDHGINATIQRLRDALGDSASKPRYIETLPRRGYRFLGTVETAGATQASPETVAPAPQIDAAVEKAPVLSINTSMRIAGGLALAVIAFAFWWLGRSGSPQSPRFERLSYRRGAIQAARFVPNGRSVVYAASWDGQPTDLFFAEPGTLESRPLGVPSTALFAVTSPGRMAVSTNSAPLGAFSQMGTLAEMPLTGGAPREVLERVQFADWTKDGAQLALVVTEDNGSSRLEYPKGRVLVRSIEDAWIGNPRVSPNGELVAFADHYYTGNDGAIAVVDSQGRKRRLTPVYDTLEGLAWSPNGKEIWFTSSEGGTGQQRLRAVTLGGAIRLVAQIPGYLHLHDIAGDGRVLLSKEDRRMRVYFMGPGDSIPRDLTWHDWGGAPVLSADGKTLVMTGNDEATGGKTVTYLRSTDGSSAAIRLGDNVGVSLSPDGQWVATVKNPSHPSDIVLLPVKAGTPIPIYTGSLQLVKGFLPGVAWHPDCERILFSARETAGGPVRTFIRSIRGGKDQLARPVTPEGLSGGFLTPDGSFLLAFDSVSKAFLVPVDDNGGVGTSSSMKALPWLTSEYRPVTFSADGRGLFVTKPGDRPPKIYRMDLATGRREMWKEIPVGDPASAVLPLSIRISPNGESIAYAFRTNLSELYVVHGLQ